MKIPQHHDRGAMELKMTPMIDVVFLLLVFFVWTSSFELPEFDLPSAIAEKPAAGTAASDETPKAEAFDEIVIRLKMFESNLVIQFNGQDVAGIASLQARLQEILALGVQPPVIVDPADEITMNVAVQIYDIARAAGADRVLFAAEPDPTGEP